MSVRTVTAAAALTAAAVAVLVLVRRRDRRLRREAVAERLMAGRVQQDNAALREAVEKLHRRLRPLLAQQAVVSAAALVLDDALSTHDQSNPPLDGGPR